MNGKIDLMLFDDSKLVFSRKNVDATIKKGDYIIYKTEDEYNKYDYNKNIFIRTTSEMTMELDFFKKNCKFIFKSEGICEIEMPCSRLILDNEVTLTYSIDETVKNIKIIIKK